MSISTTKRRPAIELPKNLPDHVDPFEQRFQALKAYIHQQLVEQLDLSLIEPENFNYSHTHIRRMAEQACKSRDDMLNRVDLERLIDELVDEVFNLGPLQKLMDDPEVTDILVNDAYTVYIERRGRLELTDVIFADDAHLIRIIQRIVGRVGRRVDEVSPMVDARLPDGSRVNAVIPPLALDGPSMSIRRFGAEPLQIDNLLEYESIHPRMVEFLQAAVDSRVGIIVSGGTGAGKTTLLNALSRFIPPEERLVTIEDSAELILQHKHRVRMETRTPNTEGVGQVTQRDLVRNSLRMRPDRIIVGEVRGAEVWDMLQAMNTGHEGSMTTIHANSARDALARLEMMCAMTGFEFPVNVVRQYISAGIKLITHVSRLKGGVRKVAEILEIVEVRDGEYLLEPIFGFRQTGISADRVAEGHFYATGYRPECLARFQASGSELPDEVFNQRQFDINGVESNGAETNGAESNGAERNGTDSNEAENNGSGS